MAPARNYRHAREKRAPRAAGTAIAALNARFRAGDGKVSGVVQRISDWIRTTGGR
jgi:hypothetical protein